MQRVELDIDVSEAARLGEPAHIALTVHLPLTSALTGATKTGQPVVCFAKPGGGYSRGYYTIDLPGPGHGSQAEWHANRGWVFVSIDHLGVGGSSTHHDGTRLDYTTLAAANQAAEQEVLQRLAEGTLVADFPAVTDPLRLGIGQSMGGCMTVIQQGRYHCYDGIGVLGYSAVHTHPPTRPGQTPIVVPWLPRDTLLRDPSVVLNTPQLAEASQASILFPDRQDAGIEMGWGFFYDDVDTDLIRRDLANFPGRNGDVPPWASTTLPLAVAASCLTPGAIAPEAASVTAPVLVAMGERDVLADPMGEPRAYLSAKSVDLFICPRMGHMHNFAGTRELFWQRIESWAGWVAALTAPG